MVRTQADAMLYPGRAVMLHALPMDRPATHRTVQINLCRYTYRSIASKRSSLLHCTVAVLSLPQSLDAGQTDADEFDAAALLPGLAVQPVASEMMRSVLAIHSSHGCFQMDLLSP